MNNYYKLQQVFLYLIPTAKFDQFPISKTHVSYSEPGYEITKTANNENH